jgi:hypothetical protein
MNRHEIVRQLHLIVDARLFGTAAWPVDRESTNRLHTTLLRMGLVEEVPGQADTWRNTPLGNELHIDLLEVFMGLWDEWDIPEILQAYGLYGMIAVAITSLVVALLALAPRQLFGYGRSDWSSKLIRGLASEAPAGFRSRRGDGHDQIPVAPHCAPFPSYKAPRVHHTGRRRARRSIIGCECPA